MRKLMTIVVMATAVTAYKDRRNSFVQPLEDFPPYQTARHHPPFQQQSNPFRDQPFKVQDYQSYRPRPYRQDMPPYSDQLPFKQHSLLDDYSPNNRPFFGDSLSYKDAQDFKRESSFFVDGASFKDKHFKDATGFRNEQFSEDQFNDDYSYQQFRDDFRFSDLYNKQISSFKGQEHQKQQGVSLRTPEYLKHGNHGLGYVSMPPISSYENVLPLNEGTSMPTTSATAFTSSTLKPLLQQSTVSSTSSAINQVHTPASSESKMASLKASHTATTVKSNSLASASASSTSTPTVATMPAAPLVGKQSSNLANPQTALTTVASLPVMPTESPIISFGRQTIPPLEFQTAKFTASSPYYDDAHSLKNKLQSLLGYLMSQQTKTAMKSNEASSLLNYVLPDLPNNSLSNKIPSYILPEESKSPLNDNLQTSPLNYLLQHEPIRGLSFQPSSPTGTMNYVPLAALAERPKLTLPNVPIATLSAVSRPLQTVNYLQASSTMPRVPAFMTQHSSTSVLPLATPLSSNHAASIFNSLPSGLSNDISAGIPSNLSPGIPSSLPTLNFAQNLQHVGQLRQFEAARSQPYSTGLQMQLGGFGGIDYTLRSSNPAPRSVDLGIAKMGLSLPELPRQQLSTFSKGGFEQQLW